jgi:hypothetical protein
VVERLDFGCSRLSRFDRWANRFSQSIQASQIALEVRRLGQVLGKEKGGAGQVELGLSFIYFGDEIFFRFYN